VVGIATGNALAVAITLFMIRHNLRFAVSLSDARQIFRRGRAMKASR